MKWKNRIIGSGIEDAEQLLANPLNARIHPQFQQEALEGVLDTVGWVDRVIVNKRTGFVVDGHLRVMLALKYNEPVPVDYVDLTEAEEAQILAAFDYITGLAYYDRQKTADILNNIQSEDVRVQQLFASMNERIVLLPVDPLDPVTALLQGGRDGLSETPLDGDDDKEVSDGSLLALVNVTIAEPTHQVESGQVWKLGDHLLIVGSVMQDWQLWMPHIKGDDVLFVPYPGVFVPLTLKAEQYRLVMVQPDRYIAGHILDRWAEQRGAPHVA